MGLPVVIVPIENWGLTLSVSFSVTPDDDWLALKLTNCIPLNNCNFACVFVKVEASKEVLEMLTVTVVMLPQTIKLCGAEDASLNDTAIFWEERLGTQKAKIKGQRAKDKKQFSCLDFLMI